jgi:hypothetical protein
VESTDNGYKGGTRFKDTPNEITYEGADPVRSAEYDRRLEANCSSEVLLGDLTGVGGTKDGKVNSNDLSYLFGRWKTTAAAADLDANGTVGLGDLSILLKNWTG